MYSTISFLLLALSLTHTHAEEKLVIYLRGPVMASDYSSVDWEPEYSTTESAGFTKISEALIKFFGIIGSSDELALNYIESTVERLVEVNKLTHAVVKIVLDTDGLELIGTQCLQYPWLKRVAQLIETSPPGDVAYRMVNGVDIYYPEDTTNDEWTVFVKGHITTADRVYVPYKSEFADATPEFDELNDKLSAWATEVLGTPRVKSASLLSVYLHDLHADGIMSAVLLKSKLKGTYNSRCITLGHAGYVLDTMMYKAETSDLRMIDTVFTNPDSEVPYVIYIEAPLLRGDRSTVKWLDVYADPESKEFMEINENMSAWFDSIGEKVAGVYDRTRVTQLKDVAGRTHAVVELEVDRHEVDIDEANCLMVEFLESIVRELEVFEGDVEYRFVREVDIYNEQDPSAKSWRVSFVGEIVDKKGNHIAYDAAYGDQNSPKFQELNTELSAWASEVIGAPKIESIQLDKVGEGVNIAEGLMTVNLIKAHMQNTRDSRCITWKGLTYLKDTLTYFGNTDGRRMIANDVI